MEKRYETRSGDLFVRSWARVRRVSLVIIIIIIVLHVKTVLVHTLYIFIMDGATRSDGCTNYSFIISCIVNDKFCHIFKLFVCKAINYV